MSQATAKKSSEMRGYIVQKVAIGTGIAPEPRYQQLSKSGLVRAQGVLKGSSPTKRLGLQKDRKNLRIFFGRLVTGFKDPAK